MSPIWLTVITFITKLNFFAYAQTNIPGVQSACVSLPCQNNGLCLTLTNGYTCYCLPDYSGSNCEIYNKCVPNPCLNDGTCQSNSTGPVCLCSSAYYGSKCENTKSLQNILNDVKNLGNGSDYLSDNNTDIIIGYINYLQTLPNNTLNDTIEIVDTISNIVKNTSSLNKVTDEYIENGFKIISSAIQLQQKLIDDSQFAKNSSLKLIASAEQLISKVVLTSSSPPFIVNETNIKGTAFKVSNITDFLIGIQSPRSETFQIIYNQNELKVGSFAYAAYINKDAIKDYVTKNSASDLQLSFVSYPYSKLFLPLKANTTLPPPNACPSNILSNQVISVQTNKPLTPINGELVNTYFTELQDSNINASCLLKKKKNYKCVYWDSKLNNGSGDWNSYGCRYTYINKTHTCSCNHTTNFAFLISLDNDFPGCDWCATALLTVSVIGSGSSIICLTISVVILVLDEIKKKRIRNHRGMAQQYNNLFVVLCVNLILFNAFYIVFAFVNNNNTNSDLCKAVGILLHFFLLTTFTLMLSLSFLRFILLFKVFEDMRRFNAISIFISYGVCTILVLICVFIPYENGPGPNKYITPKNLCYIHDLYLLFVWIPIGLILIFNFIILLLTVRVIIKKSNLLSKHKVYSTTNNKKSNFEMLKIIAGCVFTSGLTWLFGFLVLLQPDDIPYLGFIFAMIFCVLNSFQGVFIFFSCILLKRIQSKAGTESQAFTQSTGNTRLSSEQNNEEPGGVNNVQREVYVYNSNLLDYKRLKSTNERLMPKKDD